MEIFRLRPPSLPLRWTALKVPDKRRCRPAYGLQLPDVGLRSQVPEGTIDYSAMLQRGAKGRGLIFISPGRGRYAPALLYYYTYYSIRAFFKEKPKYRI